MKNTTTLRFFLSLWVLLFATTSYGQTPNQIQYSPGGLLDNVYDHYGNHYTLDDIKIPPISSGGAQGRWTDPSCNSGIFRLSFTAGSGFLDSESVDAPARRAVVCKVFSDLSNFIVSPLASTNQKVEIWVQDINGLLGATTANPNPAATSGVLGMASGFNVVPAAPTSAAVTGGILDNEVWKTIHTGVDSYRGVVPPLALTAGASNGNSGGFYHGYVAINFSNTTYVNTDGSLGINWNLSTTGNCPNNLFDLYTVVLHEVTHALGFASLMNNFGASGLGTGYNYYSRYDTFLQTAAGTPFLSSTGSCNPMYNNTFIGGVSNLHPGCPLVGGLQTGTIADQTASCGGAIRYNSSTQNIPVYTPQCFETGSSLSHFEDTCFPTANPSNNNTYFVMSNLNMPGVAKRFLKPEERNTLCDIGYNTTTNHNGNTYTSTCTGIAIAGVNDGIIGTGPNIGQYAYIGIGTTASPIQIAINGTGGILSNDINTAGTVADIRIECLQDVYDPNALINGTSTPYSSNTSVSSVTFSSTVVGLHLLRYVPIVNGVRGNITYVFVFKKQIQSSFCGQPNQCDLVINGGFEQHSLIPSSNSQIQAACNWMQSTGSTDYYSSFSPHQPFPNCVSIPCNDYGHQDPFTSLIPNNFYAGILRSANYTENIYTTLKSPLLPNTTYRLSFRGSLAERRSANASKFQVYIADTFYPTGGNLAGYVNITDSSFLFTFPDYITNSTSWQEQVIIFTTPSVISGSREILYFGNFTNFTDILNVTPAPLPNCTGHPNSYIDNNSYTYIDDISLTILDALLSIPNVNYCTNIPLELTQYLNPAPAGGTFTQSLNGGAFTAITNNTFTPTTAGNYTINYTYNNNVGCPVTISDTIVVTPAPSAGTLSFAFGSQNICVAGAAQLQSTVAGGTWSSSNNAVAQVQNTGFIMAMAVGTATITYTVTANGCTATTTKIITINPKPTIASIVGNICYTGNSMLWVTCSPNTGLTYQWFRQVVGSSMVNTLTATTTNSTYLVTSGTPANYWVVITNAAGCITTSGMIRVAVPTAPTFNYPSEMLVDEKNSYLVCQNNFPVTLPTVSTNTPAITGVWHLNSASGAVIATATGTGTYVFVPNAGQCAANRAIAISSIAPFVLQDDVLPPVGLAGSAVNTYISILTNDYQGSPATNLLAPLSPTITPFAVSFPNGLPLGISYTGNGYFTIQPTTAIGTYTFVYKVNTTLCGSYGATVTIVVEAQNQATSPPKLAFDFCYDPLNSMETNGSNSLQNQSFYDEAFVNGVPADNTNAYIAIIAVNGIATSALPAGWVLDQVTGALILPTGTLPTQAQIKYTVCPLPMGSGGCSSDSNCSITVRSPLRGDNDVVYINANGDFLNKKYEYLEIYNIEPGHYNVLSNDFLLECPSFDYVQATTTNVTFTPNNTSPNFFINSDGFIDETGTPYTENDTFLLTYTIALTYNNVIPPVTLSQQLTVLITVVPNANISRPAPPAIATKATAKSSIAQRNNLSAVYIPDANLKDKLLHSQACCSFISSNPSMVVDANGSGEIETAEAENVYYILINNANIADLTGLEKFVNLKYLFLSNNQITTATSQVLPSLIENLGLYNNPLNVLSVSHLQNLYTVSIQGTQLSSLDFGSNHNLTTLRNKNSPNLTSINIKNGIDQDVTSANVLSDCWANCPLLANVCVDASEMAAVQGFLANCGGNASIVNSNCALGTEQQQTHNFSITPNPSSGIFTIAFGKMLDNASITVYNVLGQKIMAFAIASKDSSTLNLTGYPSGAYLVVIENGSEVMKQTIIKK